jgi:pantetheine-phosphate adenylyltransferase
MTAHSTRVALCAGTFDPLTLGHVDIILRAAALADRVIVGVLINPAKSPLMSLDDRVAVITEALAEHPSIEVRAFSGLLVDAAREWGASMVVRGVRGVHDWDYESQLAQMNRHLAPDIETVFLAPDPARAFISSTLVREAYRFGGAVDELVPPPVARWLTERRRTLLPEARQI